MNPLFIALTALAATASPRRHLLRVVGLRLRDGALPTELDAAIAALEVAAGLDPLGLPDDVDRAALITAVQQMDLRSPTAWYETALGWQVVDGTVVEGSTRRQRGSFYTPPRLVEALLDAALSPALQQGDLPRVLDPTCGGGHFLSAAAQRIAQRLGRPLPMVIDQCVYGVDRDPGAVELCRMMLHLQGGSAAALRAHIRCGDALVGAPPGPLTIPATALLPHRPEDRPATRRFRAFTRTPTGPLPEAPTPLLQDAWCAAFLWPRTPDAPPPPVGAIWGQIARGEPIDPDVQRTIATLVEAHHVFHWSQAFPEGFDVVLGNPPFLNQLAADTATGPATGALLRARFPGLIHAYTDIANILLYQSLTLTRPGGYIGMVQPQSLLAAQDNAAIRLALAEQGSLSWLGYPGAFVFDDADVLVCAVAMQRGGPRAPQLTRAAGAELDPLPPIPIDMDQLGTTWTPLIAEAFGVPRVALSHAGTLGDLAETTADFRDEYYGLVPAVIDQAHADDAAFPPLISTGLIDPACCLWGQRRTRFGRQGWEHPRIDRAALSPDMQQWAERRLQPKILLATQTRILEALADPTGRYLTVTPILVIYPRPADFWRVAAILLSPVASAWALERYGAVALSADAIKLSAAQVRELPLPVDEAAWAEAAREIEAAHDRDREPHLIAAAEAMLRAYRVADPAPLLAWWKGRWRASTPTPAADEPDRSS